ncbi:unnamed protein product [Debaryomyces fabryi]|nr:unnamed protein product [Debaryomyces fabryi]
MSDLFSTYESDLQLALQEAKSKLAQVSSADGSMYSLTTSGAGVSRDFTNEEKMNENSF